MPSHYKLIQVTIDPDEEICVILNRGSAAVARTELQKRLDTGELPALRHSEVNDVIDAIAGELEDL